MILRKLALMSNNYASNQNYPKRFVETSHINWQLDMRNGLWHIKSLFMA